MTVFIKRVLISLFSAVNQTQQNYSKRHSSANTILSTPFFVFPLKHWTNWCAGGKAITITHNLHHLDSGDPKLYFICSVLLMERTHDLEKTLYCNLFFERGVGVLKDLDMMWKYLWFTFNVQLTLKCKSWSKKKWFDETNKHYDYI